MSELNLNDDFKNLLVENLADTKLLKEEIIKIKNYMRWRMIMSIIWVTLIILPLIASFFFIPDIISGFSTSTEMIRALGL